MNLPSYRGFGSALRTAYRATGSVFHDAFEFIGQKPAEREVTAEEAINRMRAAAAHLSAVSDAVIARTAPTARQVISEATDEAASFHA